MRLLALFTLCLSAFALDNSVTVHDASGSSQTARPMSVMRFFAQGEFSGTYPKPRIDGVAPANWQVDVKTTWPDGSIQQAFVSFRLDLAANGSAAVDFVADPNPCHLGNQAVCEAAALTQQGMLDHNGGAWSATWYGSVNSIEYSASARAMLTAGAWRWWMKGPVVSAVIAEDRSSALLYDFGWQYSGGVWIAPSEAKYKSLHPVYEIRFYPDPDGAGALTAWPGVEVDAQIWNASMHRLQRFDSITLMFKTGNAEATTAYTASSKSFHARSRRHKLVWSGTTPGSVVVDYNLAYLVHTRLVPSYDPSLAVSAASADTDIATQTSNLAGDEAQWCDTSNGFCGNWQKAIGTTGARGDIALIPRWYLRALYLMGHSTATVAKKKEVWDKLLIGNADAAGHAPIHYMATAAGTFYPAAGSDSVIGRVVSLENGREWWPLYGPQEESSITSPPAFVCGMGSPCDARLHASTNPYRGYWQADGETNYTSHAPSMYPIPYLLTGYHYYLAGAQMEGAFTLATTTSGANSTGINTRQYGLGIVHMPGVPRAIAWATRNIWLAALVSPDGTVERAYFKNRLENNAAFQEGVMLLTTGAHAPADPTCAAFTRPTSVSTAAAQNVWCQGRDTWSIASGGTTPTSNPTFQPLWAYTQSANDGFTNGHRRAPAYMLSYMASVWAWIANSGSFNGPDAQPVYKHVRDAMAAHYAGRVLSSANSMFQFRASDIGFGDGANLICPTFDACAATAIVSWALDASMTNSQTTVDVVAGSDWQDTTYGWFNQAYAKIGDEYVRLLGNPALNTPSAGKARFTISQRGAWGSTAASHTAGATVTLLPLFQDTWAADMGGGYPVIARAALAQMAGADQIGDYSPTLAYQRFSAALPYQNPTSNPHWALNPLPRIASVTATGGTGTAALSWVAPDGAACKVHVGSAAPTSSSDAGDAAANATKGRRQTYSASGLTAGTNYYRISCGTARASGTVTVN